MISNIEDGSVKKIQTEAHRVKGTENTHQVTDLRRFIKPKQIRYKQTTSSHIRVKLLKIRDKENNLKSS